MARKKPEKPVELRYYFVEGDDLCLTVRAGSHKHAAQIAFDHCEECGRDVRLLKAMAAVMPDGDDQPGMLLPEASARAFYLDRRHTVRPLPRDFYA